MGVTRKDFTASRKHSGYYTRDLGDNGSGDGSQWVEVLRKDGYALGAVPVPYLEQSIEAFERQNVPATGYSIDDIFSEGEPQRLEPPEETPAEPAPDANPEVVVEGDEAAVTEEPAKVKRR
jgi:hypothetical protein